TTHGSRSPLNLNLNLVFGSPPPSNLTPPTLPTPQPFLALPHTSNLQPSVTASNVSQPTLASALTFPSAPSTLKPLTSNGSASLNINLPKPASNLQPQTSNVSHHTSTFPQN